MKVRKKYQIILDFNEAVALKKILGSMSDKAKQNIGLNANQIESVRELYNLLPYENENNRRMENI